MKIKMKTNKITRLEVISEDGRELTLHNIIIDNIVLQDGDRTLKIFIEKGVTKNKNKTEDSTEIAELLIGHYNFD